MFSLQCPLRAASAAFALAIAALLVSPIDAHAQGPAPIWTGAYIGFHGGGTWGSTDFKDVASSDTSDWNLGGHAGYNMNFGAFVAGIEGDLSTDGGSAGFAAIGHSGSLDTNWIGTLRGRVGVPVGPALLYATAGFAWKGATFAETAGGLSASQDHTFFGAVYGIGAESYVLPNLSVRLEALRFDYGAENLSLSGLAGAVDEIDPSDTVVRAGVTFHLN